MQATRQPISFYPLGWCELPYRANSFPPLLVKNLEQLQTVIKKIFNDRIEQLGESLSLKLNVDWEKFNVFVMELPMSSSDDFCGVNMVQQKRDGSLKVDVKIISSHFGEWIMWNELFFAAIEKGSCSVGEETPIEVEKKIRSIDRKEGGNSLWKGTFIELEVELHSATHFPIGDHFPKKPLQELIEWKKCFDEKMRSHSWYIELDPLTQVHAHAALLEYLDKSIARTVKEQLCAHPNKKDIDQTSKKIRSLLTGEELFSELEDFVISQLNTFNWYQNLTPEILLAVNWRVLLKAESTFNDMQKALIQKNKQFKLQGPNMFH